MPNYLSGEISTGGFSVEVSDDDGSNFDNVGTSRSVQSASVSAGPVSFSFSAGGTGVGIGGGSKPEALHTEYATEGDDGPAYGTQDLVFYLQRSDADDNDNMAEQDADGVSGVSDVDTQSAGAGVGVDAAWSDSSPGKSTFSAQGATGPNPDNGQVQSGFSAIGAGAAGRSMGRSAGGPMPPLSGFDFDEQVDLGEFSQNASRFVDVSSSLINAVKRVEELNQNVENFSFASSEKLFAAMLLRNFNPDLSLSGVRDAEQILGSLERPPMAELAVLLAEEAQGRIRAKDIVRAINEGEIGFVSSKSRAFQNRMGPVGKAPL